jgi:hypothetical protein
MLVLALAAFLALIAKGNAGFHEYSRSFGTLTPQQLADANATLDRLRFWTRAVLFGGLAPLDVATLALSIRARGRGAGAGAVVIAVVCVVLALGLAGLVLLAVAIPRAVMVG